GLSRDDIITLEYETDSEFLQEVIEEHKEKLKNRVHADKLVKESCQEEIEVKKEKVAFNIK
ncbi:MAG: hypothetical protein ABEJ24_04375, partial [Candidatus Magasanikbacteria bacterium]